ncbi:valine--pyruvate transaminase [Desulfobotulus sp.]|jgi:valine--pyruvate aminotransferase|uniref:valine--pyruvate transaminase n=1 Tax=Desulfobotulus sp. TaxID=1940337 RepID=UPI002A36F2F5|nr:valine--pyruvate transaminase [Desulfobotulus sp.]MDY0161764.1 valine--pyruvate transaminase [Desulfobotulus sp.]
MRLSAFGKKFSGNSGILQLMEDLGNALAGPGDMIMMGGGNPAHIPEVEAAMKKRLCAIVDSPSETRRMIGIYDPPQGEKAFIAELACLLNRRFDWHLKPENIALTNGSQSAFFLLFNMFAGPDAEGGQKKILLPLAPEYIGYADVGLVPDFFTALKPRIEFLRRPFFKYRVDFQHLTLSPDIAALCVSRPTNPTGNVLTDGEILTLDGLAKEAGIPLILDSAYGTPFPDIIFTEAQPFWNENIILCMSLSKLGLPAARTGIVIAREDVIQTLSRMNAVMNLATGSFGAMMALDMVRTGEILSLSQSVVKPYYRERAAQAVALFEKALTGTDYFIHKPEGAIFLWLWFRNLPISSQTLYERLKARGVLVVPGHHFFPGIQDAAWPHCQECIRVTYGQAPSLVEKGIGIIGEEVRRAYEENGSGL